MKSLDQINPSLIPGDIVQVALYYGAPPVVTRIGKVFAITKDHLILVPHNSKELQKLYSIETDIRGQYDILDSADIKEISILIKNDN